MPRLPNFALPHNSFLTVLLKKIKRQKDRKTGTKKCQGCPTLHHHLIASWLSSSFSLPCVGEDIPMQGSSSLICLWSQLLPIHIKLRIHSWIQKGPIFVKTIHSNWLSACVKLNVSCFLKIHFQFWKTNQTNKHTETVGRRGAHHPHCSLVCYLAWLYHTCFLNLHF